MVHKESITSADTPQYPQADHGTLEWTIILQFDDKRAKRLGDCGRRLSRVYRSPCGAMLRVHCSCREHLCPKEREKSLREQIDSALQAATELEHPTLYFASWTRPDASWDVLTSMRKTLTADQDVRYWMQDFRPHEDGWEYRLAWIGQGPTPEVSGVQLNPFSVKLVLVEAFLCFVRTPIDAFTAGDKRLAQYLDVTRRRQFVQRLGKKGKTRGSKASDDSTATRLLSEVRAIIRGETTPLGEASNEAGTDNQPDGHKSAPVPTAATSTSSDSHDPANDTDTLTTPGPRNGQHANGHSGPGMVPSVGTPTPALRRDGADVAATSEKNGHATANPQSPEVKGPPKGQPHQKGPRVRCRRCGSREWSYVGHYMESGEGLVKVRGSGPEWLALSEIDLTVDEEQAFKGGRPTW